MKKLPVILFLVSFLMSVSNSFVQALDVTATNGSAAAIQTAVDQVAAAGGGNVYIPAGTFNFVNVGEAWTGARVTIPAGVNLFGAATQRDANGQVIQWNTVIRLPWDVPSNDTVGERTWFYFAGSGNPNLPSRFSDIKLEGYREIDANSTYYLLGVWVDDVADFRVDHNYFRNVAGKGVMVTGLSAHGVIDHNRLVNTNAIPAPYEIRTVGYGIYVSPDSYNTNWDSDINNVIGHYTNYSVFVEDNYFSGWRHCIAANHGAHYVFRHNTIQYDTGYGSIDCHGPNNVGEEGTRAVEIYDNIIMEWLRWSSSWSIPQGILIRSGGGVIFNNTIDETYKYFLVFSHDTNDTRYYPHDVWIWNNAIPTGVTFVSADGASIQDVDYFLYAKSGYTPYPYPHPLTLEGSSKVKLSGRLLDKSGNFINAKIIALQQGTVKATNDTINGYYTLSVPSGIYDIQFNFTSIPNYYIKLNSVNLTSDRTNILNYINYSSQRISFFVDFNDSQRIETYSSTNPRRVFKNGSLIANVSSLANLQNNTWFFDSPGKKLSILVNNIPFSYVTARSGSVQDIQAAIDEAISKGIVNVKIPEGTFVFNANATYRVNINVPIVGMNISGTGINKTVLDLPDVDITNNTIMFKINCKDGGRFRISGITFKGRDPDGITGDAAIMIISCKDFRVDHNSFYDMGAHGVAINDHEVQYGHEGGIPEYVSQGVVDHNQFYNIYKPGAYQNRLGYGYGAGNARASHYRWTVWDDNIWNILGKYDKNVFIEDNYFTGTRHAVASSNGGVYVFRHNIVENQGMSEASTTGHPVRTNVYGMRATENYNNIYRYTGESGVKFVGILMEGGGGVIFNNTIDNLSWAFGLGSCENATNVFYPQGNTNDVWIWDNTVLNCGRTLQKWSNEALGGCPEPVENVNYFLHAPPPEKNYKPYTYPHPLTLQN